MEKEGVKKVAKIIVAGRKNDFKPHDFMAVHFKAGVFLMLAAILAAGYFFMLKPKYGKIQEAIGALSEKELQISALEARLKKLNKTKNDYDNIDRADLEKIDIMLPDTPLKDELITEMEKLVLKNGLLMTSLQLADVQGAAKVAASEIDSDGSTPGGDTLNRSIGQIKVNMEIVGTDYDSMKKILGVFESNIRLLDITSVNFTPGSDKISLELLTYYLKRK